MAAFIRHCVILPSYNSGRLLEPTLRSALAHSESVILVIDGSNDGSDQCAEPLAAEFPQLQILRCRSNQGKGGAVLLAMQAALAQGFTHAVIFDADGQHEASDIPKMIARSVEHPDAMILGVPIFGPDAPSLRVKGRRAGNWWTNFETLWGGIEDSLFGFRIYPIRASIEILENISGGRRFDFETQLAVRLYWKGIPAISFPSKVTYPEQEQGGISQFKYFRDNLLLIRTHLLLSIQVIWRFPCLLRLRRRNLTKRK